MINEIKKIIKNKKNIDFIFRLTPRYKMREIILDNQLNKVNNQLIKEFNEIEGYIVKDVGKFCDGFHCHGIIEIKSSNKLFFLEFFNKITLKYGFNFFIEEYDCKRKYIEYMINKLNSKNNWIFYLG